MTGFEYFYKNTEKLACFADVSRAYFKRKRCKRKAYAQTMFAQHPELFPHNRRQSILNGVVQPGMAPFEAKLAGGAFAYKVVADKAKWPEHSDPLKVMWAQSLQVDNSAISMTFKNGTQFLGQGDTSFRVDFELGRAVRIEKLGR